MKVLYRYICVVSAAVASFCAAAQNLDPTVVVDRAYEGKLMEVHKPSLDMAVPDSVMRFDLEFDYSVFESPYESSYEFNPYLLSMKPSAATQAPGKFYLRAGAGYQLHPELDLVWSPVLSERKGFSMDVYARHRSFVGKYRAMLPDDDSVLGPMDEGSRGYDLDSRAGVDMKYDWTMGSASLDLAYYGLHQGINEVGGRYARGYNALDASFSVGSKPHVSNFIYGVDGGYRFANDLAGYSQKSSLYEHDFNLDAVVGGLADGKDMALLDFGVDFAGYIGYVLDGAAVLYVTPHYVFDRGRFKADIGVRIMSSTLKSSEPSDFVKNAKEQIVYPDVDVRYSLLPEHLVAYFKAGGGASLNSLSSMIRRNRFATVEAHSDFFPTYHMGLCIEPVSLAAGFEGRLGRHFSWNLNGGYSNYASGVVDAMMYFTFAGDVGTFFEPEYVELRALVTGIEYAEYQKAYASFDARWDSERFAADAVVTYTGAWGNAFQTSAYALKPAAVTGNVSLEYNYSRRIFVGVNCEFSTAMKGVKSPLTVPGYADLGLSAEYVTSRNLSFWVKGGNLLGMTIPRELALAQKGPYFTLGICLNL